MKSAKLPFSFLLRVFILSMITNTLTNAQDFPLKDFVNVYFNSHNPKYRIESYQTDTTLKSKREFLNRLKVIDPASYNDIQGYMEMNGEKFPQSFFITDIDKNGIQEYFITESYEGISNFCFTFINNKLVKFLKETSFEDFLIENPRKIWVMTGNSYIGAEFGVLSMASTIYRFNLTTLKNEYLFKLYEAQQLSCNDSSRRDLYFLQPKTFYRSKGVVLSAKTALYADYSMSNKYQNEGIINKGAYGWVIADTLNSYFAVFDSTTSYMSDSLGREKITYKDRGYLMCWIPKKVAEFSTESGVSGLYEDPASKEYLRVVKTKDNLYINYFSAKSFERGLLIDSSDLTANKYAVRFKKGGEKYLLESKENCKVLECTNPNQKKQKFVRIE